MEGYELYINEINKIINRALEIQREQIKTIARVIAQSIADGGIIHVFGSGHSHILAKKYSIERGD